MGENVVIDKVSNDSMENIAITTQHECPFISDADDYALDKTSFILEGNIHLHSYSTSLLKNKISNIGRTWSRDCLFYLQVSYKPWSPFLES